MTISIGNKKLQDNVDKKGDLTSNVQEEKFPGQSPEKPELHWREER